MLEVGFWVPCTFSRPIMESLLVVSVRWGSFCCAGSDAAAGGVVGGVVWHLWSWSGSGW